MKSAFSARLLAASLGAFLSLSLWIGAGHVSPGLRLILVYVAGALSAGALAQTLLLLRGHPAAEAVAASPAQLSTPGLRDPLTGLPSRDSFDEYMKRILAGARRRGRLVGVLCLDLDKFKHINDTLGHTIGDSLLQNVARRIESCLRGADLTARWGGDEFLVGLPDIRDHQDAARIAAKLAEALRSPHQVGGNQILATAAIGVSLSPKDGEDINTLRANADRAMYRAKSAGGNRFEFYSAEFDEEARDRLELQQNLVEALDKEELALFYQPQFDLKTNQITALEALVRWRHPQRGLLRPDQFLQLAEDSGFILSLDAWALETACRQIRRFSDAGCGRVRISVNVSRRQFVRPGFEDQVLRAIQHCEIEPGLLELELTEDLVMRDFGRARQKIESLRKLGVRVSIDDFGSGSCSLSLLRDLALDQWKIDRSFVRDLDGGKRASQLLESIVRLARGMGVSAVAEGVESVPQLRALRAVGCEQAQGFLLGMPRPAAEIARLILHLPPLGSLRPRAILPAAQNPMWRAAHTPEPVPSAPTLSTGSLAGFLTVGS